MASASRSATARDRRSIVIVVATLVAFTLVGLFGLRLWFRAEFRADHLDYCRRVTGLPLEGATMVGSADDAEMSTQVYVHVDPSETAALRARFPEVPRPDPWPGLERGETFFRTRPFAAWPAPGRESLLGISGCSATGGNRWLGYLDPDTGELWLEIMYPDRGGDLPGCMPAPWER